jgi:hypothetical protein
MLNQNVLFSIGNRIQVTNQCYSKELRGAVGLISSPPANVVAHDPTWQSHWKLAGDSSRIYWIEFDPMVAGDDPSHPIEAAEIEETDLEHYPG